MTYATGSGLLRLFALNPAVTGPAITPSVGWNVIDITARSAGGNDIYMAISANGTSADTTVTAASAYAGFTALFDGWHWRGGQEVISPVLFMGIRGTDSWSTGQHDTNIAGTSFAP